MPRALLPLLAMAFPLATTSARAATPPQPVTFLAADAVTDYADYYPARSPKALILLFHQAGSGKGEYRTIAPRLVAAGYSALALDARAGGTLFGANQTVRRLGHAGEYLDAKRDLEAALAWAQPRQVPVILWGSSYSAALVFLVAADHPGAVKAVLSFSPGEYLGTPTRVRDAAARVHAPVYVTSARDADEEVAAKTIFDVVPPDPASARFMPRAGGVHGSSTLIEARNPRGAAENWTAMLAFLKRVTG